MVNGLATFRSTVVKPYYRDDSTEHTVADVAAEPNAAAEPPRAVQPRRRGRPAGSKNKLRTRAQYLVQYLTKKEEEDFALTIKLRNDGVINTLGTPFEASDQKEVDDLVG